MALLPRLHTAATLRSVSFIPVCMMRSYSAQLLGLGLALQAGAQLGVVVLGSALEVADGRSSAQAMVNTSHASLCGRAACLCGNLVQHLQKGGGATNADGGGVAQGSHLAGVACGLGLLKGGGNLQRQ